MFKHLQASPEERVNVGPQFSKGTAFDLANILVCVLCFVFVFLRRGVRSDAQLSCTETRFQKCSQNGKNGSEHPMLSISMAYNVISC